jgi:hypothetical protein
LDFSKKLEAERRRNEAELRAIHEGIEHNKYERRLLFYTLLVTIIGVVISSALTLMSVYLSYQQTSVAAQQVKISNEQTKLSINALSAQSRNEAFVKFYSEFYTLCRQPVPLLIKLNDEKSIMNHTMQADKVEAAGVLFSVWLQEPYYSDFIDFNLRARITFGPVSDLPLLRLPSNCLESLGSLQDWYRHVQANERERDEQATFPFLSKAARYAPSSIGAEWNGWRSC